LLNAARAEGWPIELTIDDAVYLNSVYRGRYPKEEGLLPHGDPTEDDARRAVDVAAKAFGQVDTLLSAATT
jgi:hypothetical protein